MNKYILITNGAIALITLLPVIYALYHYNKIRMTHKKVLAYGIGLIIWGGIVFIWLSSGLSKIEASSVENVVEQTVKDGFVQSLRAWVYVFPAVVLAIGVNLITHYLTTTDEKNA